MHLPRTPHSDAWHHASDRIAGKFISIIIKHRFACCPDGQLGASSRQLLLMSLLEMPIEKRGRSFKWRFRGINRVAEAVTAILDAVELARDVRFLKGGRKGVRSG